MGVKNLKKLGKTAEQISDVIEDINSINNKLGPRYDALIDRARTLTGNDNLLLADLSEDQINNGLLEGRGTENDITETKNTLIALENVITKIRTEAVTLPDVDE